MSEWDKLNRWEKGRITRLILYGTPNLVDLRIGGPRGPMSEEHKKRIRQTKKRQWVNLPPEVREKRIEQLRITRTKRRRWEDIPPEERKARGRAISEGLKKSKKFKEAIKKRRIKDPETWRKKLREAWKKRRGKYGNPAGVRDYEAYRRAISEGKRKSKMLKEGQDRTVKQ